MSATTKTETRTHADLKIGEITLRCGHRFEVTELFRGTANGREVVRFVGKALGGDLVGTGYDGGVYGGFPEIPCDVEVAG